VGSFTDPDRARETATRMQSEGYSPVFISSFQDGAQAFYRIWVGEYRERDGAEGLARKLARNGYPGFVLLGTVSPLP
jgi:cell division septation protein DedD